MSTSWFYFIIKNKIFCSLYVYIYPCNWFRLVLRKQKFLHVWNNRLGEGGKSRCGWMAATERENFQIGITNWGKQICGVRLEDQEQRSRGIYINKAAFITLSSWIFSSPSLKRLPPASWTAKGTLPCPEKNLNDGVTWIVEVGNPITAMELWCGEKTQNLVGVWVRAQNPQQWKTWGQDSFRGLESVLGTHSLPSS